MTKRDRIFTIVLCVLLGNLTYYLGYGISALVDTPTSAALWAKIIADIVAIIGVFYFMRTYLKGRKIAKLREKESEQNMESQNASK